MLHLIFIILLSSACVWAFCVFIIHFNEIMDGILYLVKNIIYYGCIPVTLLILAGLAYSPDTRNTDKWNKANPGSITTKVDLYAEFGPDVTPDKQK